MNPLDRWILLILAVFGSFFIAGIAGSIVSDMLGYWDTPGAGFCAALAVVLTTYLVAPDRKFVSACRAFAIGAVVAWFFLEPSWYPEHYLQRAYEPTHLPLIVTYLGGAIGLAIASILRRRAAPRT
jgi:hypothetical protein